MAWSDKSPDMLDKLIAAGLADDYVHRPPLPDHLAFYLDAFWDLCGERVIEGGGIPYTVLDRYAARIGLPDDEPEAFLRFTALIRRLDAVFLKVSTETAKQKAELAAETRRAAKRKR
jgi:hypothetical protein